MSQFRKSSFCDGSNGFACVEVKIDATGEVAVRDSKMPGKELSFTRTEWQAFVAGVKRSEFDA